MPPVVGQAQPPREDDPSSDEDSDGDNEAVENDAVLNQVEEETVLNLAHLQWEEQQVTPMPTAPPTRHTPTPDGVSPRPQFTPGSRNFVGPKALNCHQKSPGELYCLFFSDEILNIFVNATNSFATNSNFANWKNVDKTEMHKFHAILLVFGISCSSERRMAWQEGMFQIPVVPQILSRHRFLKKLCERGTSLTGQSRAGQDMSGQT